MKLACAERSLDLSAAKVMGVLNTTPDSFSDGGHYASLDRALIHAEKMLNDGAAIIDVGGESTRPGAEKVELQQELDRVIPVIEKIRANLDVCISVDTSSAQVMSAAKQAGAHLLNDVRALQQEGALAAAHNSNLPICLMHMQGEPETMQAAPSYGSVMQEVSSFLTKRLMSCQLAGIDKSRLLIDPGFGFGKTVVHNYALLAHLNDFKKLEVPILVGLSRKSMIAAVLDNCPVNERLMGSVAGAVIAVMNGAHIVRVHDVKETVEALKVVATTKSAEKGT